MTAEAPQVPAPPAGRAAGYLPPLVTSARLCDCGCLRRAQILWAETDLAFSGKCGPDEDRIPLASGVSS